MPTKGNIASCDIAFHGRFSQHGYAVLHHTELTVHFIYFAQIQLRPIPRFLGSGLERQYAAISAADSTNIPSVGRSKNISSTFVGVGPIAHAITVHVALCRCSSSDTARAISINVQQSDSRLSHVYRATVLSWTKVPRPSP